MAQPFESFPLLEPGDDPEPDRHLSVVPDLLEEVEFVPTHGAYVPKFIPNWRKELAAMPSGLSDDERIAWICAQGMAVVRYGQGARPITYPPTNGQRYW